LKDAGRLSQWLGGRDDVADLRVVESLRDSQSFASRRDTSTGDGELLTFRHVGSRESEAALLREIVEAGFAVVEFGTRHKSLEDVFLHVTEGRVE
jgi:ABC-2 type transport system ATP-binding protein